MLQVEKKFEAVEPAKRHHEIDLIQSIISRLSDQQFRIKGLCLTMLGFFLYGLRDDIFYWQKAVSSLIVLGGCYFLDRNYLQLEKLYRMWFDFLQVKRHETNEWLYVLRPKSIREILKDQDIVLDEFNPDFISNKTTRGRSLNYFYGALLVIMFIFYVPAAWHLWVSQTGATPPKL